MQQKPRLQPSWLTWSVMAHDHAGRLIRARDEAEAAGLDALVVVPSAGLAWLTGYEPPLLPRLTALVLRPGAETVLLVPALEKPRAVASPAGELVEITAWKDGEDPYAAASGLVPPTGRIAVSDRMWASHLLGLQQTVPDARFVAASSLLARLRARKDEGEIELLARAARGADQAFEQLCASGLEGRTEKDVAAELASVLLANGHGSVSFTIVGSGPNGASPHHEPSGRRIEAGDVVVLDFGGRVEGYGSDITRTVAVGEPSPEAKEVHEIVRRAQEAAFQAARVGVPAQDVDRVARTVIDEAGFGEAFIHRTGHGIGLEEHEPPYIVEGNSEPLEPGNCFSIEPGIYLEGRFGVRIEDIVTLTEEGPRRLNEAPRELLVVT